MKVQEGKKHFVLYYMLGFLTGILYANLVSGDYITTMGILNEYFLNQYTVSDIHMGEYIWYVSRIRFFPVIILGASGCTKLRKGAAVLFLLWTGFSCGLLFTSAVMKLGIKGILLCLIAFVPQFVFYLAAYLALLWYLYTYPETRWNLSKTVMFFLLMAVGVLLECYVNPVIMQMYVSVM